MLQLRLLMFQLLRVLVTFFVGISLVNAKDVDTDATENERPSVYILAYKKNKHHFYNEYQITSDSSTSSNKNQISYNLQNFTSWRKQPTSKTGNKNKKSFISTYLESILATRLHKLERDVVNYGLKSSTSTSIRGDDSYLLTMMHSEQFNNSVVKANDGKDVVGEGLYGTSLCTGADRMASAFHKYGSVYGRHLLSLLLMNGMSIRREMGRIEESKTGDRVNIEKIGGSSSIDPFSMKNQKGFCHGSGEEHGVMSESESSQPLNQPFTIAEVGVHAGNGVGMWKNFLVRGIGEVSQKSGAGKLFNLLGFDVDPLMFWSQGDARSYGRVFSGGRKEMEKTQINAEKEGKHGHGTKDFDSNSVTARDSELKTDKNKSTSGTPITSLHPELYRIDQLKGTLQSRRAAVKRALSGRKINLMIDDAHHSDVSIFNTLDGFWDYLDFKDCNFIYVSEDNGGWWRRLIGLKEENWNTTERWTVNTAASTGSSDNVDFESYSISKADSYFIPASPELIKNEEIALVTLESLERRMREKVVEEGIYSREKAEKMSLKMWAYVGKRLDDGIVVIEPNCG